jgi:hypothetical protein
MLCGNFSESTGKKLQLNDVDGTIFVKVLDVWCGRDDCQEVALAELPLLATVADQFQMTEVTSVLEEAVMGKLSLDMIGDVLMWSGRCGMQQLEAEALEMAATRFEEFTMTEGFARMGEEALTIVVDDDRLVARNEEAVWEAVVGWMRGGARGRGVVSKIRFALMEEEYLRDRVAESVCQEHKEWMAGVVLEALRAKAARREGAVFESELLGRKALEDRVGLGVRWEEYREGGELRLGGHDGNLTAIVACDGRMCSGSLDGSIRVWSRASGENERTLWEDEEEDEDGEENVDPAYALAVWEGRLISGHHSGKLRVWNVATGECGQVHECHNYAVTALAVCGSRMVSSSEDGSIRVWAMPAGAPWACERELLGHDADSEWARSLAGWQDKVASGWYDGSIRVWDAGTGALDATLAGHSRGVRALVVHGDRLLSASDDGTIRAWALGTWAGLRTVEAYGREERRFPICLAVSGSKLVSGSAGLEDRGQGEVRVWGLAELDLQKTLRQPHYVNALVAVDGEVWGGVEREVVVWGWRP